MTRLGTQLTSAVLRGAIAFTRGYTNALLRQLHRATQSAPLSELRPSWGAAIVLPPLPSSTCNLHGTLTTFDSLSHARHISFPYFVYLERSGHFLARKRYHG